MLVKRVLYVAKLGAGSGATVPFAKNFNGLIQLSPENVENNS